MSTALRIDGEDPTPPYEQLRRQLVALMEEGTLTEGTRLPPVRQLAADLRLAAGTVARTYRELENLGLVRARRGAGTTVTSPPRQPVPEHARRQRLDQLFTNTIRQARRWGATDDEITTLLKQALEP